jgi:hypothetical protein
MGVLDMGSRGPVSSRVEHLIKFPVEVLLCEPFHRRQSKKEGFVKLPASRL